MTDEPTPTTKRKTTPSRLKAGLPPGRPSKMTPEVLKILMGAIRAGCSHRDAAQAAGISLQTFHQWKVRGNEDRKQGRKTEFARFADQLRSAESRGIAEALGRIQAAGAKDWRAAAWMVEKLRPKRFGKQRVEVSGPEGDPVQVHHSGNVMVIPPVVDNPEAWVAAISGGETPSGAGDGGGE